MDKIITINNQPIKVKEYKGQRIVTLKEIDMVHERTEGTAGRNFRENRDKFIEGVDYFKVCADEIRTHKIMEISNKAHEDIVLITASGYLMLIKSLNDELAWKIQRELVNNYFTVQKLKKEYHKPIDKAIKQHFNIAETIIQATGVKPGLAYSVAISEAEKETGYKYEEYKKLLPSANHDVASFNPTQIGEKMGGIKAHAINTMLERMGLQEKKEKEWRLTEEGKDFGEEIPYTKNGHSNYRILWHEKVLEKLGGNRNDNV
ncbi:MAG: ORF6N domain-containing protein [Clostridia bacterium]|nr:ORF6N domain-containing protein [Clostridia bacterium]